MCRSRRGLQWHPAGRPAAGTALDGGNGGNTCTTSGKQTRRVRSSCRPANAFGMQFLMQGSRARPKFEVSCPGLVRCYETSSHPAHAAVCTGNRPSGGTVKHLMITSRLATPGGPYYRHLGEPVCTLHRTDTCEAPRQMQPATAPMMMAAQGWTTEQPLVTATRPASTPLPMTLTSYTTLPAHAYSNAGEHRYDY